MFEILHHGAVDGVTGSCHELRLSGQSSVLIDCGAFQGAEADGRGTGSPRGQIDFDTRAVQALVVTHVHVDHVGRIPHLLAAGYRGPILCSEASADLLPLVMEDALKLGFTRNEDLIGKFLEYVRRHIVPLPYGRWHPIDTGNGGDLAVKLKPAGHILGSAYVECRVGKGPGEKRVVFSGDLGAPYAPLLPAPRPPYRADVLVLESTYGERIHEGRGDRVSRLKAVLEHALENRGTVMIPAFSIGRTQEVLYELEEIVHKHGTEPIGVRSGSRVDPERWGELEIIVDSPLASRFTEHYRRLRRFWDAEARRRLRSGRHPLSFEQLTTIDTHHEHLNTVERLRRTSRPAVVVAGSGMCNGGRIVNYLKALVGDPAHDVLFVGYQARGTPGRAIQQYGPRNGYVDLDGRRYTIRAAVHTIAGYSPTRTSAASSISSKECGCPRRRSTSSTARKRPGRR